MSDMNPADELLELTRQVRAQLARHIAAGAWAAPGGATARSVIVPFDTPVGDAVVEEIEDVPAGGRRSLAQIRADVGDCTRCKLSATRKSIVFGVGDPNAPLMFVGEGPGEQEDKRGEPFVGPAGELLDKMIEAMGWSRRSVFINNIVMCRPPGNRNPEPEEVAACKPFLDARIGSIAPRIIVALGRPAANTLLGRDAPISSLRGKFHDRNGVRVMPTFHPAYLLREPDRKRDTWADLKLVMAELQRLGIAPPGTPRG
jgi:DNA polymerase